MQLITVVLFNDQHESIDEIDFETERLYFRWLACTHKKWAYLLTYIVSDNGRREELYL